ncbi:MAG TPA: response regulator [Candidatus Sulfotelmatobacter sp.]|nr:response regulator [Candidatus Sulfotelmatobacter sp.]
MGQACHVEGEPRVTILVVEDEPLIQLVTSEALHESGYRVLVAGDADEAIGILTHDASVGLLFTDIVMPGALDGFGLAAWAKSVRPDLKVLYTSGYSWAAAQANAAGVHGAMLRKPYRAGELQRAVRSALANGRGDETTADAL